MERDSLFHHGSKEALVTRDEAAKLLVGLAEQHDIQAQRLIEFGGYDDAAAVYAANVDALRQGISALKERDLIYGELNKALGSHAPEAWDRIKAALTS